MAAVEHEPLNIILLCVGLLLAVRVYYVDLGGDLSGVLGTGTGTGGGDASGTADGSSEPSGAHMVRVLRAWRRRAASQPLTHTHPPPSFPPPAPRHRPCPPPSRGRK